MTFKQALILLFAFILCMVCMAAILSPFALAITNPPWQVEAGVVVLDLLLMAFLPWILSHKMWLDLMN